MTPTQPREGPLDRVGSVKLKLGMIVAVSVLVATTLAALGSRAVPVLLLVPVTVVLALGVTQLLAVGMTAPLREMTWVARQMAAGDYSGRVVTSSQDEVGDLARAFNTMAEDLAAVDRERRELVATVSHELRTPLTALCLTLENLADGVVEADSAELAAALSQAQRLAHLVDDLLDLSRLQAGAAALSVRELDLRRLVQDAVAEADLARQEVRYDVAVDPPGLTVRADPARIGQVLANLLDNASRHSPRGGQVRVLAGHSGPGGSGWWLEVTDEGDGVQPDDRERVFDRYGTLAGAEAGTRSGGTGLGLAIARWAAELHGGRIRFVDPEPGASGARVRLEMPAQPRVDRLAGPSRPVAAPGDRPRPPAHPPPGRPDASYDLGPRTPEPDWRPWWPDTETPRGRLLLPAALAVGGVAGAVLPERPLGLAWFVVLVAGGLTVLVAARDRRDPFTLACAALCFLLAVPVLVRDAAWISMLCVLAGGLVLAAGVTRGRTLPQFVVASAAWPAAGLRGLPWLGRSVRRLTGGGLAPAVVRTGVLSLVAAAGFAVLFASADAVFARWASYLLPDWRPDMPMLHAFVAVFVAGVVLTGGYLAMNPPALESLPGGARRPVANRFEWLAPVLLVDGVFVVFLLAQATAIFGGHGYLRRTTGLTYAEYVHTGFGQLTIATVLTLLVVGVTGRKAAVRNAADRRWLMGSLGLLCALTLVVVASALYRMHVYQQAYGFTRLRLLVDAFEGWLGLVVLAVMIAGAAGRTLWVARFALLSGAAVLVAIAALNPDAWIARHNLERYAETGRVDWHYLRQLSADAVPVIATLPDAERRCALALERLRSREVDGGWLSWNLGRARAAARLDRVAVDGAGRPDCPSVERPSR